MTFPATLRKTPGQSFSLQGINRHDAAPLHPRPRAPQTATWQVPWVSSVRELPFAFSARHGVNAREPAEARGRGTPTADRHARSPHRSRGGRPPATPHLLRGGLGVGDGATGPRGRGTQMQPSRGLQGLRKLRAPGPVARAATPSTDRPSAPPPPSPPLSRLKARRFPDSARPSAHPAPLRPGVFCPSPAAFSDLKPSLQVGCEAR